MIERERKRDLLGRGFGAQQTISGLIAGDRGTDGRTDWWLFGAEERRKNGFEGGLLGSFFRSFSSGL